MNALSTHPRYLAHGPFRAELKRRVDRYFENLGVSPHGSPRIVRKTVVILAWFLASYLMLLGVATTAWQAALLAVSLGLAMAGIGFDLQHDGNHGGYSTHPFVNRLAAFGLDLLGGASYNWSWKHNIFHHSNPNVAGIDADIDLEPFVRMSPAQKWRPMHRLQFFYLWPLYSLLAVKWHFFDDFNDLYHGKIGENPFPRPTGARLWTLVLGKVVFFSWAFVLPSFFHPFWQLALVYLLASATLSVALALTFQMAHCVEGNAFPARDAGSAPPTKEWAVHQVEATADFAPGNPFVTWYMGGLNYQVEHHLFPKVCHVHLPQLAPIVEAVCKEQGIRYHVNPTTRSALASHARFIRKLGRRPEPAPAG